MLKGVGRIGAKTSLILVSEVGWSGSKRLDIKTPEYDDEEFFFITLNITSFRVNCSCFTMSQPSTRALHADDPLNRVTDVAPPIHLSTTFRFPSEPENLIPSVDPVVCLLPQV